MHVLAYRNLHLVCVFFQPQSHILILSKLDSFPARTKKAVWLAWGSCPYLLCNISTRLAFWWSPSRLAVTRVVKSDNKEGDIRGQPCHRVVRLLAAQKWWSKTTASVAVWMVNFSSFLLSLRVKSSTCYYSQGASPQLWSAFLFPILQNKLKAIWHTF